jgi:hypothetical protein
LRIEISQHHEKVIGDPDARDIYCKTLFAIIMSVVKFAVPKGSIEEVTFKLLEQAWQSVSGRGRTYRVKLSDP